MTDLLAQAVKYREKARQSLREADANFLFGEYLAGAECMWLHRPTRLRRYVIGGAGRVKISRIWAMP